MDAAGAARSGDDAPRRIRRARRAAAAAVVLGRSAGGGLFARPGQAPSLFDSLDGAVGHSRSAGDGARVGARLRLAGVVAQSAAGDRAARRPRRRRARHRRPPFARRTLDAAGGTRGLAVRRLWPELGRPPARSVRGHGQHVRPARRALLDRFRV